MKNLQNIIFDFGGVILDIDHNLTRKAFQDLGVKNFDEMYSQANADQLFQNLETGVISNENFFIEFNNRTGLSLSPGQISEAWNAILLDYREESLQFLDKVKSKYNIYLLCNTNFIHKETFDKGYYKKQRKHPFNEYFKKAFYSCEIGLRKPDADSFQWILDQENIKAEETLFIDDSIQNIEKAQKMGFQTILFTDGMKIENLGL